LINHQHHYHPQEQINRRHAHRNHRDSTTIRTDIPTSCDVLSDSA
jgi:hypothetical protein